MKKELVTNLGLLIVAIFLLWFFSQQYTSPQEFSPPDFTTDAQNNSSQNNLTGLELSLSEISRHNNAKDCWIIVQNNVYAVTNFLANHPGGAEQIRPFCGGDATQAFATQNGQGSHSSQAESILSSLLLGAVDSQTSTDTLQNASQNAAQSIQKTGGENEDSFEDFNHDD